MSIKYGVLCFILIMMVLFLAIKSYETLTYPVELALDKGTMKKSEGKLESPPSLVGAKEPPSLKSYISIAEKNIFNPDRKDFPGTASSSGMPLRPMVRPSIILYGITLAKDYQSASITHPGRPLKKGERELVTLKVGERVGDYKLAKIFPDRITLEAEGDTFEILLYDSGMPKRRSVIKTESKPASITSTQPTPASPSEGVSKPPQESVQRPLEPVPGRIATPPPLPAPARPSFPPPSTRRGRGSYTPPSGSPTSPGSPIPPGTPPQETE